MAAVTACRPCIDGVSHADPERTMETGVVVQPGDVQAASAALGLLDWMRGPVPEVTLEDAATLRTHVGAEALEVPVEAFKRGLEVELEHGSTFPDANVTNGHPVLTAQIVLAHLKESLLYYEALDVAEFEGDLLKAIQAGNQEKTGKVYRKLLQARITLAQRQLESLDGA
jgi:hypothetical protein